MQQVHRKWRRPKLQRNAEGIGITAVEPDDVRDSGLGVKKTCHRPALPVDPDFGVM